MFKIVKIFVQMTSIRTFKREKKDSNFVEYSVRKPQNTIPY